MLKYAYLWNIFDLRRVELGRSLPKQIRRTCGFNEADLCCFPLPPSILNLNLLSLSDITPMGLEGRNEVEGCLHYWVSKVS